MIFWIIIALVTAAVVLAITFPLLRPGSAAGEVSASAAARGIFASQLEELERSRKDGALSAQEFESAKAEISRRFLKNIAGEGDMPTAPATKPKRALALVLCTFIPVAALTLYFQLGNPEAPSQTPELRAQALKARAEYQSLVDALEAALAAGKGDAQGWRLLVDAYRNLDEPAKVKDALRRATVDLPKRGLAVPAEFWAQLGAAEVGTAGGTVSKPAQEAFANAMAVDPKNIMARFYLGLAAQQAGDSAKAFSLWSALQRELPDGMPLKAELKRRLDAMAAPEP